MRIGLYNLEPKIENTAMMKVSQYHKQRGDEVEIYNHLFKDSYDKVYAFSLFNFTSKAYITKDMIYGGTGFNISKKLPIEIEVCDLDYSIFPNCKTSYVWFSRGCFRNCEFCVVRQKEGDIRPVWEVSNNLNGEYISIMDNNFFGSPNWKEAIDWLISHNQPVDFQSGIDVRIFNDEHGEALQKLKFYKQLHIAWDNPKENIIKNLRHLIEYIKPYKIMCYVLVGYDSTPKQDMFRIEELMNLKIDPFVMPYNKKDRYQMDLARWCNKVMIRKSCRFKDYKKGSHNSHYIEQ